MVLSAKQQKRRVRTLKGNEMNGARDFAGLFQTGQYGRLYLVSASHGRGRTFRIYVLPEGEAAIPNGACNGPLNSDAVEVYGAVSGNPGWSESYGWLHEGRWQGDFSRLINARSAELAAAAEAQADAQKARDDQDKVKKLALLSNY